MRSHLIHDYITQKQLYAGATVLIAAALAGATWYGYTWYKNNLEHTAYKDLAESIDGFIKTRDNAEGPSKWVDVERGFAAGAARNTSSKLHPYFLVYEADALHEQGKQKEAIVLMDKAVHALARTNPLYYLYALKSALMKIDTSDEALQKQGRQELSTLAQDAANPLQEKARSYSALDRS